jgi:hypothetical protein
MGRVRTREPLPVRYDSNLTAESGAYHGHEVTILSPQQLTVRLRLAARRARIHADLPSPVVTGFLDAGECTVPVGVTADVDDLSAADGEDLAQLLRRGRPGSLGLAGHGESEDDGVAVDFHAVHGGHGPVGKECPVPLDDLSFVAAVSGPVDPGVQERSEQVEVAVTVGGCEVPGDVGHDAGAQGGGTPGPVTRVLIGWFVRGDAVALQDADDLLAGWFPGDPHAVAGGAGLDQQAYGLGPVAWLAGLLAAADGGEGQRVPSNLVSRASTSAPASRSSRTTAAFP